MFALQRKRMSPSSLTGLKDKNSWKLRRYYRAKVLFSLNKNLLLMVVSGWFCLKLLFQKFNSPFALRDCYPIILTLDNPSFRTHPHAVIVEYILVYLFSWFWYRLKFGYLCIREILFLTKSYVCTYVLHVSWGEISHFKHSRVSEVNRMATRILERKSTTTTTTTTKPILPSD